RDVEVVGGIAFANRQYCVGDVAVCQEGYQRLLALEYDRSALALQVLGVANHLQGVAQPLFGVYEQYLVAERSTVATRLAAVAPRTRLHPPTPFILDPSLLETLETQ